VIHDIVAALWDRGRGVFAFEVAREQVARAVERFELDADSDAGELFLALGCDAGNAAALRRFDDDVLAQARPILRRHGATDDVIDEVLQRLREDLLVRRPGDEFIRLVQYAGLGRLPAMVRVSAVRQLRYLRTYVLPGSSTVTQAVAAHTLDSTVRELWSRSDPELHVIGDAEQQLFKRCFGEAVAALTPEARSLLRFYFLEELTYRQIAELYGVNKSTVCRQLVAARERLLIGIGAAWERATGERWGQDLRELLDGELDLSLSRLFA
jgi:RNA polymerase sigma-70 factor, ECF subfamily